MTQEEMDKRIEERIQAEIKKYQENLEAFEAGKNLVNRWIERVPDFKNSVQFSETPHKNIIIWAINQPDVNPPPLNEEWDENQTELFQLWFQENHASLYIMDGINGDDSEFESSEKWLNELELAIANRIAWLQRVKGIAP
jgi:hypothetical protein